MPKLTKAEKKARKLEKKLKKQQEAELIRRQLLHDELSREIAFGQSNIKEHEKKWKQMLINMTLPRMKSELEYAWHSFEKIIDFKDFEISYLLDELNESEEQYLMNFKNHSENIEKLLIKFEDYLNSCKNNFEVSLSEMKADAEKEVAEITEKLIKEEEYFKMMLYGLEMAKKEQENWKYKEVWDSMKLFFKNYHNNTGVKLKLYNVLWAQDEAVKKICVEQMHKLVLMQKYYKKLREQFARLQKNQENKLRDLCGERQYFAYAFVALKTRLNHDTNVDGSHLTLVTIESNVTREHLLKVAEKGKKLLQLAAVCRKLETDYEIILPFPKPLEEEESSSAEVDERGIGPLADLDTFWRKVARADAIRNSMIEEKEYLKKENLKLKKQLQTFCKCIECPAMETKSAEFEKRSSVKLSIPQTDCKIMHINYSKHNK
ncbi:hypothetical protein FQR65_LT06123 [Abscondita terminalis]|nr:hypothetical protein FQR65_LT06123 [Abscondita terminalis]